MKISFFDYEMSNLSPKFGQLLCGCMLGYDPRNPRGYNLQTFTLTDYKVRRWDDRELAKKLRDALEGCDIIVSWNGKHFDIPFLNGRLAEYQLREVNSPRHEDLMFTARRHLRCMGAKDSKLDTIAKKLRLPVQKTPMEPRDWVRAIGGHRPSYDRILQHCQHDVKVLAFVWERLKHLVREIK